MLSYFIELLMTVMCFSLPFPELSGVRHLVYCEQNIADVGMQTLFIQTNDHVVFYSFVHSFIHSGDLYSASSRLLLRGAPSPVTAKEERLEGNIKFGRAGHQQRTQLNREIIPCQWAHNRKGPVMSVF